MSTAGWVSLWACSSSLFLQVANNSYIAGLVHVGEQPGDGDVADGLLEEHFLYGGRAHRAERREEQEQLPEATRLSRVPETHHWGQKQAFSLSLSPSLVL